MKILHTVRQYRPARGGLENYTEALAQEQAALGHEVTILTLNSVFTRKDQPFAQNEFFDSIRVKRISYSGKSRLFLPFLSPSDLKGYDVIHAHAFDQLTDTVAFYLRFKRAPFFITTHGLFFHTQKLRRVKEIYLQTISKFTAARATKIYACSENDRAQLQAVKISAELAYNPVTPIKNARANGNGFLYLGRLSENKRVDLAIDFFAEYIKQSGDAISKFHIVGGDTEGLTPKLKARAQHHNLNERVVFHGFAEAEVLPKLIAECGYNLSASAYEGYGLAAVEGMSAGLIPVLHNNAAFLEIYQRSGCGYVGDFDRLPETVLAFLACKEAISREESRLRAIHFALSNSFKSMAERTITDYEQACSAQKSRIILDPKGHKLRLISELPVAALEQEAAIQILLSAVESGEKIRVCFANANLAVQLQKFEPSARKKIIDSFQLILNDGIALDLASRYVYGEKFPDNLNGTDFTPAFLARLAPGTKFYFYGSDPQTGRNAVDYIEKKFNLKCVGFTDGFTATPSDFIENINLTEPAVILVAKGNPRQEIWIAENSERLNAPVIMGVGALADFLTGRFKRAPKWVRDIRCEWAYRLMNEPKRLLKRYTVDMFLFAKTVIKNL